MARSNAQKLRRRAEREGRWNPEANRAGWNGVHPVTKVTPTRMERIRKQEEKHKRRNGCHGDDGSVFCFIERNGTESPLALAPSSVGEELTVLDVRCFSDLSGKPWILTG